jgi:3D (Asp-Asp-Asp) domain-containing protein
MSVDRFKVTANGLNLRSTPVFGNIIKVLIKGQKVTKLSETTDINWWKVEVLISSTVFTGFVAKKYLEKILGLPMENFDFPEPSASDQDQKLTLWSTFYYVYTARNNSGTNPLRDSSGQKLGPMLSKRDWCKSALEGTVRVLDPNGDLVGTFNFADRSSVEQVDCSTIFPNVPPDKIKKTNKVQFKHSDALFGEGANGFALVPYRTIAVDPNSIIPLGSVIFVPDARGKKVILSSGKIVSHDGYFFAADVGELIIDNHIDVFLGVATDNPFPFITSEKSGEFAAFLINNIETVKSLKKLHKP